MAPKLVSKTSEQKLDKHGYCTNVPKGGIGIVAYTAGRGKNKKTFQVAVDDDLTDSDPSKFWIKAQQLLIKKLKEENKI